LPEISRFFGIIVAMFYNDHPPPHFHVRYGRQRAILDIATLSVLEGSLSRRVLGLVVEWAAQHQDELEANWQLARRHASLNKIARWSRVMLKDVVEVEAIGDYRLRVEFEDGVAGEVDVAAIVPFEGVFAPLRDPKLFGEVAVDLELGTVYWPNGADLDPDVLYALIIGQPTPDLTRRPVATSA